MSLPYFLTHRLVFSSFSAEDVLQVKEKLKANDISFLVKKETVKFERRHLRTTR